MKSKKLISWISALAITASAFAGLTISASAEDTEVWSDTFDGYATGVIANGTETSPLVVSDYVKGMSLAVGTRGRDGDRGWYTDTNGDVVKTGSYYSIEEKSSIDKYLHMSYPMFGDFAANGRWAYVDFENESTATAEKDVVLDFDLRLIDGMVKGVTDADNANITNPVLRLGTFDTTAHTANAVAIDKDAANIGDGWVHARIIITTSGSKLYIDGTEVTSAAVADMTSFKTIGLYNMTGSGTITPPLDAKGDSLNADTPTKSPVADVDNFIIYTATAGETTATSKAPGAQTGESDATPVPVATPFVIQAAPALEAPSAANAETLQSYDFDDASVTTSWILGDTDVDDSTKLPGLNLFIKGRSDGGSAETYAQVAKTSVGNAFQMAAGRFSTGGRVPVLSFTNDLPISDGVTTALAFEVYLSAASGHEEDAQPRLYLIKNKDQAGEDGTGAYRNIAAVLTTVQDEKIYREPGNTDSDVISVYVAPNQWHKVTFTVTPTSDGATHRVYIDDDKDNASMNCKYVYYGDAATSMTGLPMLTVESKATKVNGEDTTPNYGVATIDNILAYQGTVDNPKELIAGTGAAPTAPPATATPVPSHEVKVEYDGTKAKVTTTETTPFDAVLINASYYTDGTLESLVTYPIKDLSATSAYEQAMTAKKGGKLLVWNSLDGMLPYGKLDPVTEGADQPVAPTAAPTVTDAPAVATDAPAVSTDAPAVSTDAPAVSTDAPAVPTNAPTLAPTAVPTAVPTDEPKDDSYTAPLVHTASAAWASAVGSASKTVDKEKEYFNNDADSGWAGTAFMQFDLSEMPAAISDATVKFTVSSGKAYPVVVYYLTENPDLSTVPAQSAESRFTSARTLIKDAGNSANGDKEFELDVTDAVKAMASSGKITFMLTGNNGSANLYGKGSADKAPTLTMTAVSADAKATKYTVKYVDSNGTELKTAAERDGYSTLKYAATDEDKASFTVGEGEEAKKYIYVSGGDEITAVEDAASNVIAITFKEAAKVTYTVKSSLGDTISTKELFEADSYTYTYPKYITDANHKVTAEYSGEDAVFGKTITAGAEDTTITVDYTAYAGTAYFLDYETVSTTNTVQQLTTLSNGYGARVLVNASAEEIAPVFTVAEAGNYNVSVVAFGRNSSTDSAFGVYKNDATDANTLLTGSVTTSQNKPTTIATEAAVSIAANDNILLVGDTGNTNIDYILAVKAD